MAQATTLRLRGVALHKNRLSEAKEGQLARASNCVIDRESLVEPRRGMNEYGVAVAASGSAFQRIIAYDGSLIALYNGTMYSDNGSGTWSAYSGTFTGPTLSGATARVRDAQANSNLFVTTTTGIRKLDDLAGAWVNAGVHQPLDGQGSTTGSSGFLADAFCAGYRATLHYTDENQNEIVSAVSQRLVVTNSAGGAATRNVALTWYLPSGMTTSYYYRVYRSEQVATGTPPSDELQQVSEGQITSTNISNGYFTLTDATTDSLRGDKLYTSASQEGIAKNNDQPPLAVDACFYRGFMLYANTIGKHRFSMALLGTGSTALRNYTDATVGTTNNSPILTAILSTTTLRVGMRAKGTGVHASARILTIDSGTQVTLTHNSSATATVSVEFQDVVRVDGVEYFAATALVAANKEFLLTTSGTASQNIEATALSLIFVVNQNASADVYGFYDSGFDDTPGLIRFQERAIGGSQFQMSTTAVEAFAPTLPTTDDSSQLSFADVRPSFVMPSKQEQPEAVPVGGGFRCGSSAIKRILALRDAVIVLSDSVGIITGTDTDNFSFEQLDTTTKLVGAESAVVLNDAVYCMSTQGVVRITTSGVQIASRDIEKDLIQASALTNFSSLAWGLAYESDRAYELYLPTSSSDTTPQMYWRYNAFTEAWTHGDSTAECGIVDSVDDKRYTGSRVDAIVRQERKSYDSTDYADTQVSLTISGAGAAQTSIAVASTTGVAAGDLVVQGSVRVRVSTVTDATHLAMEDSATWANGAAVAYRPITVVVETLPFAAGNAGLLKQYTHAGVIFRDADFEDFLVSVANDNFPDMGVYELQAEPWNSASTWGVLPSGSDVKDEQLVPVLVPSDLQRCNWIRVRLTFAICRETMALAGFSVKFREMSNRNKGALRT